MNRSFLVVLIVALAVQTANAANVSCDFASVPGAAIKFTGTGDKIEFPNNGPYDFIITDGGSSSLIGFPGNIGGTFLVGTISSPVPGVETAAVTTSNGSFSIFDGTTSLTASLDWKDITIYNKLFGVMNGMGVVNLSSIAYTGSNTDLQAVRDGSAQTVVLTFQFSPLKKKSLSELMVNGQVNTTSYSGSLSAVPEPSTLVGLTSMGLAGLVLLARRFRKS
jgi:hypothetical protein